MSAIQDDFQRQLARRLRRTGFSGSCRGLSDKDDMLRNDRLRSRASGSLASEASKNGEGQERARLETGCASRESRHRDIERREQHTLGTATVRTRIEEAFDTCDIDSTYDCTHKLPQTMNTCVMPMGGLRAYLGARLSGA